MSMLRCRHAQRLGDRRRGDRTQALRAGRARSPPAIVRAGAGWNNARLSAATHSARVLRRRCATTRPLRGKLLRSTAATPHCAALLVASGTSATATRRAAHRRWPHPATPRARTRAMASGSSLPMSAASARIQPAAAHHRLRAPLLQRRIVQIGIGTRVQGLERQRRGLGEIARDDADLAAFEPAQHRFEARRYPSPLETIADGLPAPSG